MGGSASLAPIAEEILVLDAAKVYDPNGLSSRRLNLSKGVLESIRRKSYTISSRKKSTFMKGRDDLKSRFAASLKHEVPQHVNEFLDKIGVNDDKRKGTVKLPPVIVSQNCQVSMQNEKTTKLVAHIFECLGALQHLVRANQSDIPSDSMNDETQSTNDMNTKSVGKLLHEMVNIYGLCGDTINALLEAEPDAAGVEDTLGRLPLHVCCDRDEPWMDMVTALVEARPEALNCRDGAGRLPLHIALDRQTPSLDVVQLLVRAHPAAAGARRGVGRLPIHYACFSSEPSVAIIQCLLESHPEGAQAADVYGKLPLHYVADRVEPNLKVILCLLAAYPQGAAVKDSHQRTPLKLAVAHGTADLKVVLALLKAHPLGPSVPGQFGRLPLHAAVDCENPCERTIRLLAAKYPQGVFMITRAQSGSISATNSNNNSSGGLVPVTGPGVNSPVGPGLVPLGGILCIGAKDNCPFQIALNKNRHDLARTMLLACPTRSTAILADLNWAIRRIAFLMTHYGTPYICNYDMGVDELLAVDGMVVTVPTVNSSAGRRQSDPVGYVSSPTKLLIKERRRTVAVVKRITAPREGRIHHERDSIHAVTPIPTLTRMGSSTSSSRLLPLVRPTPYARMMNSTPCISGFRDREGEHERVNEVERERERDRDREKEKERDREKDRDMERERERERQRDRDKNRDLFAEGSSCSADCTPRKTQNLLQGLFIVNSDLWRLVITFL